METIVARISIMLVPALMAVTCHEVAHGYLADRFGDPTPRLLGRITFNPLRHLDPVGTLALLFFGFGWARPTPINHNNLRRPKTDMIWISLSGPLANMALAGVFAGLMRGVQALSHAVPVDMEKLFLFLDPLILMSAFGLYINIVLFVLHLIPLPPLDGGKALACLLPEQKASFFKRLEPFGFVILVFLLFFTPLWKVFIEPLVWYVVIPLSGEELHLVLQVRDYLFGL
ncbi:MAG: site-2 protease family protein [Desulfuromonadales bacterium]|nr:site-2 protease family protein [Desulfuromonadales bacterium]NIR34183.1 site-2 protease family protein [Desulfuromonadales bacterium]NIS41630.1 site-2 protease family protein [Desulfuromonadales bacterium]